MTSSAVFKNGSIEAPTETHELRAGPVTALLDGVDLRYVRVGKVETVRRIYAAVRDQNWDTIPGDAKITRLDIANDRFTVEFDVRHRSHDVDFLWHGRITGSPDGTIVYEMEGEPQRDFPYNRVGFCVLHPFRETAGRPYRGQTPDGPIEGTLPELIGPQRYENGVYVPLFPSVSDLEIDLGEGLRADFHFEGDLFEMEDQRNWTDASFKTYCTPLSRGFPHQARVGQQINQRVTVSIGSIPEDLTEDTGHPQLTIGGPVRKGPPTIGFGMASHGEPLSEREIRLLRALRPDHLRVEVHAGDGNWLQSLKLAQDTCESLGCALEAAVFITEDSQSFLDRLAAALEGGPRIARFLVTEEGAHTATPSETTSPALMHLARAALEPISQEAPFIGGTDMYFCELNRTRPEMDTMDGVCYSILPEQHAFDNRSMVETVEAEAETVKSAHAFASDKPVVVSPVTLKRRSNPHATVEKSEHTENELPDAVDPRQMSLFGAAWTTGSVKNLTESGVASITYYETAGWRGVMEREEGSPLPELFPSEPGMVFPLYHVFADLAGWKTGTVLACTPSKPLAVTGLAVEVDGSRHLLVANMTDEAQTVTIGPLPAGKVAIRALDETTVEKATRDPETFRSQFDTQQTAGDALNLELRPYAVVRIEVP